MGKRKGLSLPDVSWLSMTHESDAVLLIITALTYSRFTLDMYANS